MFNYKRAAKLLLAFCLLLSGLIYGTPTTNAALSDYVTVVKKVEPGQIATNGEALVTLDITGAPPANVIVPNDVVLIIDKSGSMLPSNNNGEDKMKNAKEAAKGFIDLMDLTKHRIAVVDYSSKEATKTFPFTTDGSAAKNYIEGISANGSTATGDAIKIATDLLADHRPEAQPVIVIMTDGDATISSDPALSAYDYAKQRALEAKNAGIIFYTIALLKASDNPDVSGPNVLLKEMATTANHHHFVLGSVGLAEIYAAIVREIGLASAYDVTVRDIISPDFEIVPGSYDNNIPKPIVSDNTLTWTFNELKNSTLSFTYKIRPVSKTKTGNFPVSTADSKIAYKDYAGAQRTKSISGNYLRVVLPAPEITSIVEPVGHPDGGESVTINGNNFVQGATVQFGLNNATDVVVVGESQITATVPAGTQGTVSVTVKNPDGQKASTEYQYKADPIITTLTPSNGPLSGGTAVIVQGNYLMKGLTVKFGENTGIVTQYNNSSYIKVSTPVAVVPGAVNVTFTNPDGTSVTVENGFTYDTPPSTNPEVLSISPNSALVSGGILSYVDGKNFTKDLKVKIGDKEASASYISSTRLKVTIPATEQSGTVDVAVVDPAGTHYILPNAFTYEAIVYPTPTVTSISPNSGLLAGGQTVYIDGTGFVKGISTVEIGGKSAQSVYMSGTRLRAVVPEGDQAGKVDVTVTNESNSATLPGGYEYTVPVVLPVEVNSVSPNSGLETGGAIVYIDGSNFKSGATVSFGSVNAATSYVSTTRLKATVPASVSGAGKVEVTVTNPDGGKGTLPEGFEYTRLLPVINSLTPSNGNRAGGDTTYIDGLNFDSTAIVTINGVQAETFFVSNKRLKVTIPASPITGEVPLVVNLANGESATATFTYDNGPVLPAPTIKSLTATSGAAGKIIYVDGTNFKNKPEIFFGSIQATSVTFVSATRIKVTVPAGNTGAVEIKVVNPDGQESNTATFLYE